MTAHASKPGVSFWSVIYCAVHATCTQHARNMHATCTCSATRRDTRGTQGTQGFRATRRDTRGTQGTRGPLPRDAAPGIQGIQGSTGGARSFRATRRDTRGTQGTRGTQAAGRRNRKESPGIQGILPHQISGGFLKNPPNC